MPSTSYRDFCLDMCSNNDDTSSPPDSSKHHNVATAAMLPIVAAGGTSSFYPPSLEHTLQFYHYAMAERLRIAAAAAHHHHHHHQQQQQQQLSTSCLHPGGTSQYYAYSLYNNSGNNNNHHPTNYVRSGSGGSSLALSAMAALFSPHRTSMSCEQQQQQEPKPQHSYIGLIAIAILSSVEKKLVLSDIYQHILQNYPYFRRRGPGWRNSIRHNLSLNDCFVKSGRSANGKGHYWSIHPANLEDFRRGDFRRRKAQRKVRRHMGLAVDEEPDSPSPPPLTSSGHCWPPQPMTPTTFVPIMQRTSMVAAAAAAVAQSLPQPLQPPLQISRKRRQFDVASLLAPDDDHRTKFTKYQHHEDEDDDHVTTTTGEHCIVRVVDDEDEEEEEEEVLESTLDHRNSICATTSSSGGGGGGGGDDDDDDDYISSTRNPSLLNMETRHFTSMSPHHGGMNHRHNDQLRNCCYYDESTTVKSQLSS